MNSVSCLTNKDVATSVTRHDGRPGFPTRFALRWIATNAPDEVLIFLSPRQLAKLQELIEMARRLQNTEYREVFHNEADRGITLYK